MKFNCFVQFNSVQFLKINYYIIDRHFIIKGNTDLFIIRTGQYVERSTHH